uniref:Uncharacterized protein n=1 Tax=Anguilla anguilla TaxID=7936 RepID=A0A0E9QM00_ANGAN
MQTLCRQPFNFFHSHNTAVQMWLKNINRCQPLGPNGLGDKHILEKDLQMRCH